MKKLLAGLEALLLLAPFFILVAIWPDLPARVPIHWNLAGQIDRWSAKMPGVFILPATALVLCALLRILPWFDPKLRRTLGAEDRMRAILPIVRLALLVLLDIVFAVQVAVSLGYSIAGGRILLCATLALLVVLGNYLGNVRPNYFLGIRTPWTLADPATWRSTHRLGGRLLVFGGLLLLGIQFFLNDRIFGWLFAAAMIALVVWAFLYSWHRSRTHAALR